jgi:tRNA-2-methylthio-N6-dimethylallyladenosine synthase
MIVGFPDGTYQDFSQTMDLLETVRFHGSFSFKYSDLPNTCSAKFADKVDEQDKGERLQCFQKRQDEISLKRNLEFLGQTVFAIVEHRGDDRIQARTGTNHIVHFSAPANTSYRPGQTVDIAINHAEKHSVNGEGALYQHFAPGQGVLNSPSNSLNCSSSSPGDWIRTIEKQ